MNGRKGFGGRGKSSSTTQQGGKDARTGSADRVTERAGAAINVEALVGDRQVSHRD